jgi:hypothetical protein
MVIMIAIAPKVRGFKPAESDGFLRAIKIRSTTSFGEEVRRSTPCRKILRQGKNLLRHDRDTDRQNSAAVSRSVSPRFATRCVCCNQSTELLWMNR